MQRFGADTEGGRIVRFGLVGVAAFLVDAAALHVATQLFGMSPYTGRVVSFLLAATVAWALNRHCTFKASASEGWFAEWGRYLTANSAGALINLSVYTVLVASMGFIYRNPVLAVGAGSLAGMAANFIASKHFVFRGAGTAR